MRHTGWCRIRVSPTSDSAAATALIPQGREVLGQLMADLALTGRPTGVLRKALPDGSTLVAQFDGTTPVIDIDVPATAAAGTTPDLYNLWAPRGFVVYPAWSDAPGGVGLPIVADAEASAYDPANLAPGLDRTRWTAGGPCGEVLLSPDVQAGYPVSTREIPVPLLADATKGPVFRWPGKGSFDARKPKGAWAAYRMELAAPVAHYADESMDNVHTLFESVNSYRVAQEQIALTLLPRGYYHPGAVMVSIMQAAGSTDAENAGYPTTYRTEADRLTKDGFTATLRGVTFAGDWTRGTRPTAFELRTLGGAAADVLEGWQADIGANAILLKNVGAAAFGDVGFRGGYWCLDVIERSRWIGAGNANWQSRDAELPPLSWHSFASVNLAWETYPATYDPAHYDTAPLVPLRSFTDASGECWLNYPRAAAPGAATMEPALSRYVYLRGRAIALAPRGGLIWGTCIAANGAADRLIALVHHPEDQPADYTNEGFTRYLRVWWADIPRRPQLRVDPQQTICGEDPADAWAWRGGAQIDLGTMPAPASGFIATAGAVNSLKYASCWRFAPDGLSAICLRDYGAIADYGVLQAGGVGGAWSAGINPRAVELTFAIEATAITTTVMVHEYTAGATAADRLIASGTAPATQDTFSLALYEQGAVAIAVDYAADGSVVYAFSAKVATHQAVEYVPTDGSTGWLAPCSYAYLGTGGAAARYATDLDALVLHGARFQTPSVDRHAELALVLDVASGTFAGKVTRPRFSVVPAAALDGVTAIARPCQTFTPDLVDGVRLCRSGVVQEDWYASPDGAVFTTNDPCYTSVADANAVRVFLPLAASANVQGFYAERFGKRIYGYQAAPTPGAAWMLAAAPSGSPCGCVLTAADLAGAQLMTASQFNPRGGRAVASVPLPDADWLIYSKVV